MSLRVEAEDGQLVRPMQSTRDPSALGGAYVAAPEGTAGARQGWVELVLAVPRAGQYVLWARVLAPDTASNSFFVSLDGEDRWIWHAPGPGAEGIAPSWTWVLVAASEDGRSGRRALAAGAHRLRFTTRQDGTRLDQVWLVDAPAAVPAPGRAD